MKTRTLTLLAAAALVAGCTSLDRSRTLGDPRVSALAIAQQVCSNCHGLDGNAVSPNFPNLAGQTETYLVAQLRGFKGQGRRDPAGFEYMWGLSRGLGDEQIQGLARYYAAQTPRRQAPEASPWVAQAGKSIYENGVPDRNVPACAGCHGASGQGQDAFPRLAGQHADYVVKQLVVFQRTDERPEGSVMKTVAHELTAADIARVSAYVQSLTN